MQQKLIYAYPGTGASRFKDCRAGRCAVRGLPDCQAASSFSPALIDCAKYLIFFNHFD